MSNIVELLVPDFEWDDLSVHQVNEVAKQEGISFDEACDMIVQRGVENYNREKKAKARETRKAQFRLLRERQTPSEDED